MPYLIALCMLLLLGTTYAADPLTPVLYKGRVRPIAFNLPDGSALNFVETLDAEGSNRFKNAPLFYLPSKALKQAAGTSRISFEDLKLLLKGNLSPDDRTLLLKLADLFEHPPLQKTLPKKLPLPSQARLYAENLYYKLPLSNGIIFLYLASLPLLMLPFRGTKAVGTLFFLGAMLLSTILLGLRWFILARPPVSNMAETMLYVPWTASLLALFLSKKLQDKWPLAAASILGAALYAILEFSGTDQSLENVQAVLNSPFWLTIHVLMIVGSYGVLLLAGILGHLLLIYGEKASKGLFDSLLLSLYVGVALLIPGTLLGGVWAAQSWGRFWDWDPKESWAFITACIYLLFIHAYRFKYIGPYGLAFGSIFGLIAVSFTWYGVNYILGSGLHSYGFGNGGEWIYYLFIVAELTFLLVYSLLFKREIGINSIHSKNREEV
jgi:ABC-type transport system involved in cytochrome c biogenesis permease subunit